MSSTTAAVTAIANAALHVQDVSLQNALISLNNSSIAILEQGQCRSSIETLKHALELLKSTDDLSYASTPFELTERRIKEAEQNPRGDMGIGHSGNRQSA